ncbi:MAG: MFS transporter [Stappiaceae bacterium]
MFRWRTPWRAVAAMFILNGALFGIWASRIPAVVQTHDLSPSALGGLLLLMAAGAIISFPIAGKASDAKGCAAVTLPVAILYCAALVLIALSPSVLTLGISLFLFGAFHGSMDVSMNAWAGEVEKAAKKPMMSSFHAMFSLGAGLGAASGFGAAGAGLSVTTHFFLAGSIIAALTLPFGWIGWVSQKVPRTGSEPIFSFPRGPLLAVGFFAFCSSLGEGGMADWSALFLISASAAGEAEAALGYAVFSVAMVVMRLLGDRLVQKVGPVNAARFAGLAAASGSAVAVIFATFPIMLIGFALMGIGYALVVPLAFSRAANDPDVAPGQAIASVSTLGYGGILLGPPLIGLVADLASIRTAFAILTVMALMIFVMAKVVRRPGNN